MLLCRRTECWNINMSLEQQQDTCLAGQTLMRSTRFGSHGIRTTRTTTIECMNIDCMCEAGTFRWLSSFTNAHAQPNNLLRRPWICLNLFLNSCPISPIHLLHEIAVALDLLFTRFLF